MDESVKALLLVFFGMVLLVGLFGFHKSPVAGAKGNTSTSATKTKTDLGL